MLGFFKKITSIAPIFFLSCRVKKTIQVSLILLAFFSIANIVMAQTSSDLSSVSISMSPTSPRAGDSVTLTVSSDQLDLSSAKITWYVDNVARSATSNQSITIKAKSSGDDTSIKAVVETSDGIVKEATKEISPAGVDLVVEPVAYTLPFYEGKPFFVGQGTAKITAIPDVMVNGTKVASKDLNFQWSEGDNVLGSESGKGQDSIVINSVMPIRDIDMSVQISNDAGVVLAENSKTLTINNPSVLFYENNPLYGILYNEAITGDYYLGTREELTIDAKPFSFSFSNDVPSNSSYVWYVNGNFVSPSAKANEIILKQTTTNLKGTAAISLDVKNTSKVLQFTSGNFNVNFGQ